MAMSLSLAGISDPSDSAAAASDPPLPPVDSLNVWGLLSGTTDVSPRMEWPLTPLGEDAVRAIHGGDAAYMAEGRYVGGEGERTAGWRGNEGCNVLDSRDHFFLLPFHVPLMSVCPSVHSI